MMFIKLGRFTINPNHIVCIEEQKYSDVILLVVTLVNGAPLRLAGDDAETLLKHLGQTVENDGRQRLLTIGSIAVVRTAKGVL